MEQMISVTLTHEEAVIAAQSLEEVARLSRDQETEAVESRVPENAAAYRAQAEEREALAARIHRAREQVLAQ